jgi:hypothetical protein
MGRNEVVPATMVLLLAATYAGAVDCGLVNAGFDEDAWIDNIAAPTDAPSGWDVNFPPGEFAGYVSSNWATGGGYSLTVYSQWFVTVAAGDTGAVSQEMVLDEIGEISFDLKLDTLGHSRWDPNVCSAVALVDDEIVWQSGFATRDIRGEYLDQAFAVDAKYRDGQPHRLGLGLRMHAGGMLFERYAASWDSIECAPFRPGMEPLLGDFDGDGLVDIGDLITMAATWMHKVPAASPCNLSRIDDDEVELMGTVNFFDFAVFADGWRVNPLENEQIGQ